MSFYVANNAWSYTMVEETLYVHFLIQHCVHVFITIKIHNFIFFINGNINIQSVLWSQSVVRRSAQLFKIVFNLWLKKGSKLLTHWRWLNKWLLKTPFPQSVWANHLLTKVFHGHCLRPDWWIGVDDYCYCCCYWWCLMLLWLGQAF